MSLPPITPKCLQSDASTAYSIDVSSFPVLTSKQSFRSRNSSIFTSKSLRDRSREELIRSKIQESKQRQLFLHKKVLACKLYRQYGIRLKDSEVKLLSEADIERKVLALYKFQHRDTAALQIQRCWKLHRLRQLSQRQHQAARRIQLAWRATVTRLHATRQAAAQQKAAAQTIQRRVRRWLQQRKSAEAADKLRLQACLQELDALTLRWKERTARVLQRWWRKELY